MTYCEFIEKITPFAEENFANFQKKLIFTNRKILGVRTPVLRKFAKEFAGSIEDLLSYPDEYYDDIGATVSRLGGNYHSDAMSYTTYFAVTP